MSDEHFHRVLQKRAADCAPDEFMALAQKYGHDDACFESLRKGVADQGRREDSGDWTSPASPGWPNYRKKRDMLDQFTLERGPKGSFNASVPRQDNARVAELEQQLAALARRVATLETAQKAQKFKL